MEEEQSKEAEGCTATNRQSPVYNPKQFNYIKMKEMVLTSANNSSTEGSIGFSELMTEAEVVDFLRIPHISSSTNYSNVIDNLKRMHDLPCIHICKKPLYPLSAMRKWVDEKLLKEQR